MPEQTPNLFNQVDQQLANGQPATVLVRRGDGGISTAQIVGMGEGHTIAYLENVSEGPTEATPYKMAANEGLTDKYQEQLAKELAGVALRGVELEADTLVPADKYTDDFIKANPYDHLLDVALTDEQSKAVGERLNGMDLRTDEQKRAEAEHQATEALNRERAAADHRYNEARQAGADHDAAEASASRAYN